MNYLGSCFLTGLITLSGLFAFNSLSRDELTIVNLNIRYDNPEDGKNKWENRTPIVRSFFNQSTPDLIGFQEVTHRQLKNLETMLPAYGWVGRGRKEGLMGGEYNPIFYRKDRFKLLENVEFVAENVISAGATGNGFEENWKERPPDAVDYIFVNPQFKVRIYQVDKIIEKGVFIADHWPVVAKMAFSSP
ncbi:MAG: hypothetical protein R6V72_11525 [Cyclobacterium sp.]|uniref:hypothetical protein n=1 Tax=unclassified Cyclobacterium TaxID=2615055 RepID=UPI0013D1DC2B|nr:hypothetical protein [Cyclobacterium sp. SYSU L10401]